MNGAWLIGLTVAAALYGIICAQTLIYLRRDCRDGLALKAMASSFKSQDIHPQYLTYAYTGHRDMVRWKLAKGCARVWFELATRRSLESAHVFFCACTAWDLAVVNHANVTSGLFW